MEEWSGNLTLPFLWYPFICSRNTIRGTKLPNTVGYIDGSLIRIIKPHREENIAAYIGRKRFPCLNVQFVSKLFILSSDQKVDLNVLNVICPSTDISIYSFLFRLVITVCGFWILMQDFLAQQMTYTFFNSLLLGREWQTSVGRGSAGCWVNLYY